MSAMGHVLAVQADNPSDKAPQAAQPCGQG